MSSDGEPLVGLTPFPNKLMSLSMAMRQAAIDVPKDLSPGVRFGFAFEPGTKAGAVHVTVKATDQVSGVVAWERTYDERGRALDRFGGGFAITF